MNDTDSNSFSGSGGASDDTSVWGVIETLENILSVMPNDVSALESLALAYEQAGDAAQAHTTLLKLGELLLEGGNWQRAELIVADQVGKGFDDAELLDLKDRVEQAKGSAPPSQQTEPSASNQKSDKPATRHLGQEADLHAELDFGWALLEAGQITQEQYERAVDALTESHIQTQGRGPISFMLELNSMENVNIDRILAHISVQTRMPFVELNQCQIQAEALAGVTLEQVRLWAAVPFAVLGPERMVAVLNPQHQRLTQTLNRELGEHVHFYLAAPEAFQRALDSVESVLNS